jgi:hypothetical protein
MRRQIKQGILILSYLRNQEIKDLSMLQSAKQGLISPSYLGVHWESISHTSTLEEETKVPR